jgi:hypothetical protein
MIIKHNSAFRGKDSRPYFTVVVDNTQPLELNVILNPIFKWIFFL